MNSSRKKDIIELKIAFDINVFGILFFKIVWKIKKWFFELN